MKKPIALRPFIINTLRKASYRWPSRNAVMSKARVERGRYKCSSCEIITDRHGINIDHVDPVVNPTKGWVSWDEYITRMFCDEAGFQVLCNSCHDKKTEGENKVRRRSRAERNAIKKEERNRAKAKNPKTNKHTGQSLDKFLKECGIELPQLKPTRNKK